MRHARNAELLRNRRPTALLGWTDESIVQYLNDHPEPLYRRPVNVAAPGPEHVDAERFDSFGDAWVCGE